MKYNEYGFTDKDYHKSLVKLTGQGDIELFVVIWRC